MNEFLAAADIGSNSARLLLAKVTNNDEPALERVLTMRFVTRLGETPGTLSKRGVELTLSAIEEFIKALAPYGGVPFFVFATSAVRDADNRYKLLDPLEKRGVRVDILSGEREAKLACSILPQTGGCIDIGGGSTELLLKRDGAIACKSFNAGAVRAKALFGEENGALPKAFYDWLKDTFDGIRAMPLPKPVYGAGGTITTLAAMANGVEESMSSCRDAIYGARDPKILCPSVGQGFYSCRNLRDEYPGGSRAPALQNNGCADLALTRTQLARVMDELAKTPHDERRKNALLSDRADIILYGAGILAFIMDELGVETVFATEKDNLYAYLMEILRNPS